MRLHTAVGIVVCLAVVASLATIATADSATHVRRLATAGIAYVADTNVSIMTEASSATGSNDEESISTLAQAYAQAGLPRILPVRGLGPIANIRDLLHMRGIDMAVLNSDVIAFAAVSGDLQGADTRLSAIAKLYTKNIFVVAAKGVTSIADLAQQKVMVPGADSDSFVTARAMFSMLNTPIDLAGTSLEDAVAALTDGRAKAVVLTLEADDRSLSRLPRDKGLHMLEIPANEALAKVYGRLTLKPSQAPGLVPEAGVRTLTVSSVLATFNWRPTHVRYLPILQFARELPSAVDRLRRGNPKGPWQTADGHGEILGWQRYEPARALVESIVPLGDDATPSTVPVTSSALAALNKGVATQPETVSPSSTTPATTVIATTRTVASIAKVPAEAVEPAPAPEPKLTAMAIEVAAHPLPMLADPQAPGGGLVAELVMASLKDEHARLNWSADGSGKTGELLGVSAPRVGLAWQRPDCGHREGLSIGAGELCDHFVFSTPVFQSLQIFFIRHGSDFTFDRDDQVVGHTVCTTADMDVSNLDGAGRQWLRQDLITLLRRPKLEDCLKALDHGDVETVFADDMSGQAEVNRLNLADNLEVVRRPVATLELCVIADKNNPQASEAIRRLDAGLAALKADGRFSDIVLRRLGQQRLLNQASAAP